MYASLASHNDLPHFKTCLACREFVRSGAELEAELRRAAGEVRAAAPATLEREVLRAVRASELSPKAPRSYFPMLAGAASLAAAIATVFIYRPKIGESNADAERGDIAAVTALADAATSQFWSSVVPPVASVVEKNPLPDELSLVYADARRALDFLAMNFLPTSVPDTPSPAPRKQGG